MNLNLLLIITAVILLCMVVESQQKTYKNARTGWGRISLHHQD